jgi:hypothetical protein
MPSQISVYAVTPWAKESGLLIYFLNTDHQSFQALRHHNMKQILHFACEHSLVDASTLYSTEKIIV